MKFNTSRFLVGAIAAVGALAFVSTAQADPIKVFILAGQSNMQGHARTTTFDYIGEDEKTKPMLEEMVDRRGNPVELDDVWITYTSEGRGGEKTHKSGKLTAGYGAGDDKIGPEFTFGIYMDKLVDEPILIIKTAWGGKSLHTDFRPPSAGPRELTKDKIKQLKEKGEDPKEAQEKLNKQSGHYYRLMMEHIKEVLGDPKEFCKDYNKSDGFELAGFVWFQGWNDMVARDIYPNRGQKDGYEEYTDMLEIFIEDVRKDLEAPELPFVIGVMGTGGEVEPGGRYTAIHQGFRDAMAAPAKMQKFRDNVVAVQTYKCWDPLQTEANKIKGEVNNEIKKMEQDGKKLDRDERQELFLELMEKKGGPKAVAALNGISNQEYHYLGSAKILGCIGKEFAEALAPFVK